MSQPRDACTDLKLCDGPRQLRLRCVEAAVHEAQVQLALRRDGHALHVGQQRQHGCAAVASQHHEAHIVKQLTEQSGGHSNGCDVHHRHQRKHGDDGTVQQHQGALQGVSAGVDASSQRLRHAGGRSSTRFGTAANAARATTTAATTACGAAVVGAAVGGGDITQHAVCLPGTPPTFARASGSDRQNDDTGRRQLFAFTSRPDIHRRHHHRRCGR